VFAAALALAASLTWGSSNYLAGLESRRRSVWIVTAWSQVVAALGAGLALLIARQPAPDLWHSLGPLFGGIGGAIGVVAFYRALAIGTMSVVAPIVAVQAVVPVVVGLLLGERPSTFAYLGMAFALSGVALVSWRRRDSGDRASTAAILLGIITAVTWGGMLVGLKLGAHGSAYWAVFDARVASVCVILLYIAASRRHLILRGQNLPTLALVGLLLTVANILYTVATTFGYLSIVSILGSLSPVVVTGYAQVLLGERLTTRQWVGVATVFTGIVLLSM
jgi:drug/metabolite transporter (DMT)-like permease